MSGSHEGDTGYMFSSAGMPEEYFRRNQSISIFSRCNQLPKIGGIEINEELGIPNQTIESLLKQKVYVNSLMEKDETYSFHLTC
jgi:hypothetical protein